jgi:hypothetical protein
VGRGARDSNIPADAALAASVLKVLTNWRYTGSGFTQIQFSGSLVYHKATSRAAINTSPDLSPT